MSYKEEKVVQKKNQRIEICGGIGAGKTTLATLLGKNGFHPVLENFKENPFWEPFYSNPNKYNFETEITFLLQHYHSIKLNCELENILSCDFSLFQDLAYAKMGLEGERLKIFENIFSEAVQEFRYPRLLICLTCTPKTLLERIRLRGRKEESTVDEGFLSVLNKDIYIEAENFSLKNQVLYINSEQYNFATKTEHQAYIVSLVKSKLGL